MDQISKQNSKHWQTLPNLEAMFIPTKIKHINARQHPRKKVYNSFKTVFQYACTFGVPFPPSVLENPMKNTVSCWTTFWCLILLLLKILAFGSSSVFMYAALPSTALRLAYIIYNAISTAILILLIFNRKRIIESVHNLQSVNACINGKSIGSKSINYHIAIILFFISFQCISLSIYNLTLMKSPATLLGYAFDTDDLYVCKIVLKMFAVFTYGSSAISCSVVLLLCACYCIAISNIIKQYSRLLQSSDIDNVDVIARCLSIFQKIVFMVDEIEHTLSICVFLLYSAVLTLIFKVIGIFLLKIETIWNVPAMSYAIITLCMNVFAFLFLTSSGSKVVSAHKMLKRIVIPVTQSRIAASVNHQNFLYFISLCEIISYNDLHLTGAGMFVINKGLYVTVAGAIVTYGMLLYQYNDA